MQALKIQWFDEYWAFCKGKSRLASQD
jgi:hypothetical protein